MEKLKPLYDSESEIPKEYASLYEEVDGKWKLTAIDGIKTQADIDKILEAKKHETDNRKTAEQELADFKKKFDGIDTSKYNELLAEHEKAALLKIDPKTDLDKVKLIKDLDNLQKDMEELKGENLSLKDEKKLNTKKQALLKTARELKLDPVYDEDVLLRTSFLDISEGGDVLTKEGKTVAELLTPLTDKFGLPSGGSGASSPKGTPSANTDQAAKYAEAKKTGDTKGMMLHAPSIQT